MLNWLYSFFFGCFHARTTFPITIKGRTYIACLKCGEEIPYNWDTMSTNTPAPKHVIAEELGR